MSTQQHVSNRSSTTRHALRKQWYRQLKDLVAALEEMSDHPVLDESDQRRLGIRLSNFSADPKDEVASEDEAQYFTPPLPENLPISPCCPSLWGNEHPTFWPREIPEEEYLAELVNDYYDGRHLADIIASHRNGSRWKYPTSWKWSSPGDPVRRGARYTEIGYFIEPKFLVPHVYDRSLKTRPHQILIMVSDHPADESSLFRTEVLVMSSFMRWKMLSMEREQSLVYPVMVISIMNLYKVRILQSHFDGTFHIRRSNMLDFAVDDHEELMKVMMCWLWSTPHGDTTLSTQIPIFKDYPRDDEDDDKKHGRVSGRVTRES
ncbi:hypothetical protein ACJ73_01602 [Blastomyces percursus]|uniref:Uncharacterized protein n=1 Tax=Blastomyces percursus TaxID=1658174 RepID=A0A1J9RHA2_9EURO|nr:hypothetical protein ACJ73_01602 [Blastomyces percursus]